MDINPALLEKVRQENSEFCELYEEHSSLKIKVEEFNKMKLITPEQEIENKKYQKLKLSLKDRMEKILSAIPNQFMEDQSILPPSFFWENIIKINFHVQF